MYNATKKKNFVDGSANLIVLERWLDSRFQNYFNLLANIVTSHEKRKTNNERHNRFIVNLTKMDSDINENLSDNLSLKCWLCKNNHRLVDCPSFKNRSISATRQFLKENKLCFNCLSKTHIAKIVGRASFAAKRTATKSNVFA